MSIASPEQCVGFQPPSKTSMRRRFAPARWYFQPQFLGLEALDLKKPALFVGNHTIFGLLDAPLMIEHLYTQHDVMVRALGDRLHFNLPGWRRLLIGQGMVMGSQEHGSALMQAGQHIMVFPGGGREVMRQRGEKHQLIWKQRTGFARLAMAHGYDIIPFASFGPDDAYRILLDGKDIKSTRMWKWLDPKLQLSSRTRGGDMVPPLARGMGPTMMPRPQKFYFGFGSRIETVKLQGQQDNPDLAWQVREQVAASIDEQFSLLKQHRETDRKTWGRLRRSFA